MEFEINKPKRKGRIVISTTISVELHRRAKDSSIQWSEALRRGITQILAEKDDPLYQNPIQQQRKIASLVEKLSDVSQKMIKYEEELNSMKT